MDEVDWRKRPALLVYWPSEAEYMIGLDENGSSDLVSISRAIQKNQQIDDSIKHFTLTGVVFNRERYDILKERLNDIKYTYWEDGLTEYKGVKKRVCFHSREIRKGEYPFNQIDYQEFLEKLSSAINDIPTKIISCHINKEAHFRKYKIPHHPYHVSIRYILERYCEGLNNSNKKGIVLLESRGPKEDRFVLKHILEILDHGTNQNPKEHFRNIIGVYFNPKWSAVDNDQKSYVILELADLISFPIYQYCKSNRVKRDRPFLVIEKKFYKFPNYIGWGLKIFP